MGSPSWFWYVVPSAKVTRMQSRVAAPRRAKIFFRSPVVIGPKYSSVDRVSFGCSDHPEILELPGVVPVHVFGIKLAAFDERRPVAVNAHHRTQIRHRHLEHGAEVDVIRL